LVSQTQKGALEVTGKELRRQRLRLGLRQSDLGALAGIFQANVAALERGGSLSPFMRNRMEFALRQFCSKGTELKEIGSIPRAELRSEFRALSEQARQINTRLAIVRVLLRRRTRSPTAIV
jgi:transcriptional regulator with XRE-family HTH domain